MKPNCYECKYRGSIPGDAHSSCRHPKTGQSLDDPVSSLIALFASVKRTEPIQGASELNIKGNPHGVQSGWFNWPWSFDPVWLESCDGFEEKEENG